MKGLVILASWFAVSTADAQQKTHTAVANISEAFVPSKSKSREAVYIAVSGTFPNSCYSYDRTEVTNPDSMTHEVRVYAQVKETMCLMVLVPFIKEVKIDSLQPGEHMLIFKNGDGTYFERKFVVE